MANRKKTETAAEITAENTVETAKDETVAAVSSEEKVPAKRTRKSASSETASAEKTVKIKEKKATKPKEEVSAAEEAPKKTRKKTTKSANTTEKAGTRRKSVKAKDASEAAVKPRKARASKVKETLSPYEETVKLAAKKTSRIKAKRDFAAQFTLTGSAEGVFFLKSTNGKVDVQPYDYKGADVNVTVDNDTLIKLINKTADFDAAVENGSLEMTDGKLSTIVALKKILF